MMNVTLSRFTFRKSFFYYLKEFTVSKKSIRFFTSIVTLIFMLFLGNFVNAQSTANYAFSTNTTGSLAADLNSNTVDMTTGTTSLVAADLDDNASSATNIGFDFYFYGARFTQFSANSNGLIGLGSTAVTSGTYVCSAGSVTTPRLSAFCADLRTGLTGKVHYKLVGTAPNRCLIVEFLNMSLLYVASPGSNDGTFQVRLYETTGIVEYVYGSMSRNAGTSATTSNVSIGFSVGTAINTTASITTSGNSVANTAIFNTNTYAASSGAITNLNSAANGSRRVYKFTPTIPNPPTSLNFSGVTTTAMTVNWTDASNELKYALYRSNDGGVTYNFVSLLGQNVITSGSQTGLTSGITYFWKVYSLSEGGLSTGLVGSQATSASFTSVASGDWNSPSTWSPASVPTAGSAVTINTNVTATTTPLNQPLTINVNSGFTLALNADYTNPTGSAITIATGGTLALGAVLTNSSTTTINGTLQINGGGYVSGTALVYGASSTLIMNNNSVLYSISAGQAFWPTVSPPFNVTINGTGAVTNMAVGAIAGTLTLNAQLDAAIAVSVNGFLQLNSGGYITSNAPVYGAASTLVYNTSYGVGTEWTGNSTTAGSGVPFNITILNAATVTTVVAGRGIAGSMNISNGTLTLNGDISLGGNWTVGATSTQNNNGKAVFFSGASGTQIITKTGTGNVLFDYLIINKAAGSVQLNSTIATDLVFNTTAGNFLQILNVGTFDLNGRNVTLNGDGGGIYVNGARTIASTAVGGKINVNGYKFVANNSGTGTLTLAANNTVNLNSGGNFDFGFSGGSITTLNGTLSINSTTNCFVNTNAPVYGAASTLIYNGVAGYGVGLEWTGNSITAGLGIPQNVTLTTSSVNMPATSRGMAGNLTIGTGSNFVLNGTSGADFFIAGNWTNSGTFTPSSRVVTFNGSTARTLTGATTFDFLTINNAGGLTISNPVTVNQTLNFAVGRITLGTNNLTVGSSGLISGGSSTSYALTSGTGRLIKQNVANTIVNFPVGVTAVNYTPLSLTNTVGTSDLGVTITTAITNSVGDATKVVALQWNVNSSAATTATVAPTWLAANQGVSMTNPGSGELGNYTTSYTVYPVTLSQYTTSATNVALQNGVNLIVVGNTGGVKCATQPITLSEGFNSIIKPSCWSTQYTATTKISFVASGSNPTTSPQEGANMVLYNSYSSTNGGAGTEERLMTLPLSSIGISNVDMEFQWRNENSTSYNSGAYFNEGVQVQYSLDGVSWIDIAGGFYPRLDASITSGTAQWNKKSLTLPAAVSNQSLFYIAFKFHSEFGDNMFMDAVVIKPSQTCVTPSTAISVSLTAQPVSVTGVIAAPTVVPSGYLVIRTTSSTAPSAPVDGSSYANGSSALGGTIVANTATTSFTDSNLSLTTQYWYWIYSYNNVCIGAPYYSATNINATTTTLSCTTATNTMTVALAGNYDWNTATNWSLGHVPYPCENAIINGTSAITGTALVGLSADVLVNSLTVNITGAGNVANVDQLYLYTGARNLSVTGDIAVNNSNSTGNGQHYVGIESSANGVISCNNMSVLINGTGTNTNQYIAAIECYGTININGTTTANVTQATGTGGQILFDVADLPAQINFNGNAAFDNGTTSSVGSIYIGSTAATGNTSGRMIFKGNTTFGAKAFSLASNIHGTTVFDAISSQTVTVNNLTTMFFPSVKIGETNTPTVNFSGSGNAKVSSTSTAPITVLVSPNSILNLASNTLNLDAVTTSSLNLSNGASLILAGTTGGQTGSNFPLNYSTLNLDANSTIVYSGATSQTVYSTPTYGNLTLSGLGAKSFSTIPTIAGNFLVSGGAVTTPATINFSGATTQNIAGLSYKNINFSGVGSKIFSGDASVGSTNALTFATANAGIVDFDGTANDKVFRLLSDVNGTARIANVQSYTVSGNVTVERYLQGRRAFRFLTPGVTTTTSIFQNWQNNGVPTSGIGTQITGGAANGFDVTGTNNPSLHTYNAQATGTTTTGFTAATNTDATVLKAGVGYRVLVRGDRNVDLTAASTDNMNVPTVLSAKGTPTTGTVTFDATAGSPAPINNNPANTQTNGYTLIGNPYISPVDWHAVTKIGVKNNAYYTWDPTLGTSTQRGRYVVYSADSGTANLYDDNMSLPATNRQCLQSGQAVFVKNADLAIPATLTFNESNKATTNAYVFRSANESLTSTTTNASLYLRIYEPNELALGGAPIDGTVALFGTGYTTALDANDVDKLSTSGENLAFVRENKNLAIETVAPVVADDVLFVKTIAFQANKNYTFKVNTTNFDTTVNAKMVDMYLNTETPIDLTQPAFVSFTTTADANSYGSERFKIVFNSAALGNGAFNTASVSVYPNPIVNNQFTIALPTTVTGNVTLRMSNMLGQEVYKVSGEATPTMQIQPKQQLEEGVYVVSITNNGQLVQTKVIVKK